MWEPTSEKRQPHFGIETCSYGLNELEVVAASEPRKLPAGIRSLIIPALSAKASPARTPQFAGRRVTLIFLLDLPVPPHSASTRLLSHLAPAPFRFAPTALPSVDLHQPATMSDILTQLQESMDLVRAEHPSAGLTTPQPTNSVGRA
jgi:hypothetical protein